ncbi:MAG: ATP-binding cassette domain-containing protein [Armatimonadota bacterium]|nr:ATP-binding cassette domain-containing protein [Armatimonadota bacterium]MDR7452095.1 ATP-binding cassette domain-containing protein [Armatimonadota bacterium]MDR7466557.1 ATP-binding cassette domain-containing protein [Armatimonadota bacterium]MDR7493279.1 ATP-binding cassette domain-containing protein [Armatimonadota bacterium]MDR7499828.1 ATP-binding cassette domain-containing protein [Armatimonadota bacterium]
MTPPEFAVELEHLTKRFPVRSVRENGARRRPVQSEIRAVDGIDLQIRRGELFGLLGPNGAGKTTTIRMLCTLLLPTAGRARVWGIDVVAHPEEVRRHLGVVLTGERSVYWKLTGRENLEYFAALYQVPRAVARRRIADLLDRVGLAARADDLVERYSTGMRQRLALIKAMVHDPPVLLLDEPTTGLDPQAARNIRDLIRQLHASGKTIILTTHYMEEADQLSERIGIIDHGRIIALDTPQSLKRSLGQGPVLRCEVQGWRDDLEPTLRSLPGVTAVSLGGANADGARELILRLSDSASALPRAVDTITRSGGQVRYLQMVETSLEDVFIALTGRRLRD